MIANDVELSGALRQIALFADMLEGLRRDAAERENTLFPTLASGPVHKIREHIAEARAYVDAFPDVVANEARITSERESVPGTPGGNGHEDAALSIVENAAATGKATGHIV